MSLLPFKIGWKTFAIVLAITITIIVLVSISNFTNDPPLEQANILASRNKPEEAKRIYTQLVNNPQNPEDLEADFHLAELYYNQSMSDSDPILSQAIIHYKKAITNGFIEAMFPLANIYNYCTVDNRPPQKQLAKAIYQELVSSPHATTAIKNRANEKLFEMNQDDYMTNTNQSRTFGATAPTNTTPAQILLTNRIIRPPPATQPRIITHLPPVRVRNDSQNVHDSGLQKTFLTGYENLKKLNSFNKVQIPQREIEEHIKDYVKKNNSIAPKTKTTALKALEHIRKTNSQITNLKGSTEMEVLTNVYNRIYGHDNEKNKEQLKTLLIEQLADTMPTNSRNEEYPVCAQGRVTRLFSIFQAIDPQSDKLLLKPKWAIKEELATLASNTRDNYLKTLPQNRQDNYNNDGGTDPENQNDAVNITNTIKDMIKNNASENYINTNILKHEELEKELKPLLDNI